MAVAVSSRASFAAQDPLQLFRVAHQVGFTRRIWYTSYDVSGDGEKFLVNVVEDAAVAPITVVLNWMAALKRN
jgi:hypothetical protein